MIDALVSGKLYGKPQSRTAGNGKSYVTAKLRTAAGDGESLFVNCITFDKATGDCLLALDDGDSVALSGALTPKVYTPANGAPHPSLDMQAHAAVTAYHVTRKRQAVQEGRQSDSSSADAPNHPPSRKSAAGAVLTASRRVPSDDGMDDDLPWN